MHARIGRGLQATRVLAVGGVFFAAQASVNTTEETLSALGGYPVHVAVTAPGTISGSAVPAAGSETAAMTMPGNAVNAPEIRGLLGDPGTLPVTSVAPESNAPQSVLAATPGAAAHPLDAPAIPGTQLTTVLAVILVVLLLGALLHATRRIHPNRRPTLGHGGFGPGGHSGGPVPPPTTIDDLESLGMPRVHEGSGAYRRAATPWVRRYVAVAVAVDVAVAVLGFTAVYLGRFGATDTTDPALVFVAPMAWLTFLGVSGAYHRYHLGNGSEEYRAITRAAVLAFATTAVLSYVLNASLARGFVLPLMAVWFLGTAVAHWELRRRLNTRRAAGQCLFDTIVVGREDAVATMIQELGSTLQSGYRIVGACVSSLDTARPPRDTIKGVPVLGAPGDALRVVDRTGADVVAVSSHPDLAGAPLRRLGWALAERQVDLVVSPGIIEVAGPRLALRPAAGLSVLHVEHPQDGFARVVLKRIVDLILAGVFTALALPVGLLIAAAIKLTSPGPVFYRQERIGAHGRAFQMIKFRSMVQDADQGLASLSRDGQVNAVLFKDPTDPRVTPVGRFLRAFSLDELPQLLNVLAGQMSIVGPRPPLPREVAQYEPDAIQRLRVLPGMTGLWQISGRSNLTWEQSLRLDLWYVDNWSPLLDAQILLRTIRAVMRRSGAY